MDLEQLLGFGQTRKKEKRKTSDASERNEASSDVRQEKINMAARKRGS